MIREISMGGYGTQDAKKLPRDVRWKFHFNAHFMSKIPTSRIATITQSREPFCGPLRQAI
jgi:hypothetical protein